MSSLSKLHFPFPIMSSLKLNHHSFLHFSSLSTLQTPKPTTFSFPKFLTTKPQIQTPIAKKLQTPKSSPTTTPSPKPQSLKTRLRNNEPLYGIFLLTFSPTIAEISALSGYDFVVIDIEHGHGDIPQALHVLQALSITQTPAIIRIPESSATWAKKALDLGPAGIMFPMIDSPKAAKKAVSYCRFPPNGVRGSAHTIVRASNYGFDEGYLGNYEEELLVMCQVECVEGVKKIGEIAGVEGVDCVQMGPLDLSASMGYLWDPGNRKVRDVMRGAEKEVLKGGKAWLGGFGMPFDGVADMRKRGYHMVSGATDVGLFRKAVVEDVRRFKESVGSEEEETDGGVGKDDEDAKYWSE